jgi:uncharacterized protein (DUF2237 family)
MRIVSVSVVAVVLLGCGASTEASAVSEAPSSTNTAAECAGGGCAMPDVDPGTEQRSVSGAPLAACGSSPTTGFYRDGRCTTGPDDHGVHVVCAEVTAGFLSFTSSRGNDLTTPRGSFAGLHEGDRWCLCASRWAEAYEAGVAPPVVLEATHARAAELIPRAALEEHALR